MNLNPIKFARNRPKVAIAIAVVAVVGISFGLYWFQPWRLWTKQVVNEALPTAAGVAVPGPTAGDAASGQVTVPPLSDTDLPTEPTESASATPQVQPPVSQSAQPTEAPVETTQMATEAPVDPPVQPQVEVPVAETTAAEVVPVTPAPPVVPAEPVVLFSGDFVTQEHGTSGVLKILQLADGSRYVRFEGFSTSDGPDLHVALTDQSAGGDWFKYKDSRYHDLGALKGTDGDQNYLIPADVDLNGLTSVVIWCERFSVAFGSAPLNQAG